MDKFINIKDPVVIPATEEKVFDSIFINTIRIEYSSPIADGSLTSKLVKSMEVGTTIELLPTDIQEPKFYETNQLTSLATKDETVVTIDLKLSGKPVELTLSDILAALKLKILQLAEQVAII